MGAIGSGRDLQAGGPISWTSHRGECIVLMLLGLIEWLILFYVLHIRHKWRVLSFTSLFEEPHYIDVRQLDSLHLDILPGFEKPQVVVFSMEVVAFISHKHTSHTKEERIDIS